MCHHVVNCVCETWQSVNSKRYTEKETSPLKNIQVLLVMLKKFDFDMGENFLSLFAPPPEPTHGEGTSVGKTDLHKFAKPYTQATLLVGCNRTVHISFV